MAYRRSQYPPGGTWGPFLDALRQQRGWSAVEAGKQLLPVLELSPTSTALYKAVEWGQRPLSDTEDAALRKHLGAGPEEATAQAGEESEPSMAAALMALAVELAAAREERTRYLALEGTVKALEETVAGLLRSSRKAGGSGASQAGRVHRTKTE